MDIKHFKEKLIESLLGNLALTFLTILFPFVVTKIYGSHILGQFKYGHSIINMSLFLATLGFATSLLYFIPREGKKYVSAAFILNMISSLLMIFILFFTIKDNEIRAMLPFVWILSAEQLFFALYRSQQQIKEYFRIKIFLNMILKTILTAIFFALFGANFYSLLMAVYIPEIISLVIYFINQRELFGPINISKELIFYSLPLILGTMMGVIMYNIDMVMIGSMLTKQDVAIYSVATQLGDFPVILLMVLNTVFPPIVAKLYHNNELDKLRDIYKKSVWLLASLSSVLIIIIIVFRYPLLNLYGPEYAKGDMSLIYRSIGQLINASVGSVWYIISMTGRTKTNMVGKIASATLNIVLNYLLIPIWGINGAAFASMVSIGFNNILGYIIVGRILKVKVYKFF